MLTSDEIKQIGQEVGHVIEDNITPQFERINQRLDSIDQRVDSIDQRVDSIDQRLNFVESQMVTKMYLDEKLADLEGATVARQRKQDEKMNRLIEILRSRNVLRDEDLSVLREIHVFPAPPRLSSETA